MQLIRKALKIREQVGHCSYLVQVALSTEKVEEDFFASVCVPFLTKETYAGILEERKCNKVHLALFIYVCMYIIPEL